MNAWEVYTLSPWGVDDFIDRLAAIETLIDPYYRATKEVQYVV